jgi:hypothetical protein
MLQFYNLLTNNNHLVHCQQWKHAQEHSNASKNTTDPHLDGGRHKHLIQADDLGKGPVLQNLATMQVKKHMYTILCSHTKKQTKQNDDQKTAKASCSCCCYRWITEDCRLLAAYPLHSLC